MKIWGIHRGRVEITQRREGRGKEERVKEKELRTHTHTQTQHTENMRVCC